MAFFALILLGWVVLYLKAPAYNGTAIFGSLDIAFAWGAHTPLPWSNVFLMWVLMILAMMLPTLVPMIAALFSLTQGRKGYGVVMPGFTGGYISVWLGFALVASLCQVGFYRMGVVDALGLAITPGLTLFLLIAAGFYQFSKWKQACLRACQAPMMFFLSNWRDGFRGAVAMGIAHGLVCVGCCWALMVLGFVGGVMNLIWMGLATFLMALEKMPAIGTYLSPLLGCVLLAIALAYGLHIITI